MSKISVINLGITNRCFNQCVFCCNRSTSREAEPQMALREFSGYAKQARGLGAYGIVLTGGEPLIHPEIYKFAEESVRLGFKIFHIESGGWRPEDGKTRISTLRSIFEDFKGKLSFAVSLSFSPLMHNANQEKVRSAWLTTLSDIVKLSPLINDHLQGERIDCYFIDDGKRYDPSTSTYFSMHSDLLEIIYRLGGQERKDTNFYDFPLQNLSLRFDYGVYQNIGRGEELPVSHNPFYSEVCKISGRTRTFSPYITPDGYLHPCPSIPNATNPQAAGIKVDAQRDGSLAAAVSWYESNFHALMRRSVEIYRQLQNGTDFCCACVQARTELTEN